jgi:capsular exopolysaccharide synthesis family protein
VARITRREEQARYREAANSLRRRLRRLQRTFANDAVGRASLLARISRLESLEDFSRPVEIAELARIPTSPYSPKPVRNVLVGLLLGFALGALVAFIRDALDRRLRGSRDIQHRLRLPVLARVRKEALGQTGAIANNGRRRAINEADLEAFRVLRTNLEFLDPQRRIRSVLVTSALPEEGKSTVAASLAGANALAGKRTLLIECDLRQPVLAARLGVKPAPGLTDYLAGKATPQEIFQEVSVGQPAGMSRGALRGPPPITCVTAGREALPPGETLGSGGFQDFLAVVARSYDSVIIDAGPVLSVADTLELIGQVDGVLVCVRASRTTGEQASALKTALDHFPARPAGIVVTGAEPDDEGGASYYAYDDSVAAPEQGSPAR